MLDCVVAFSVVVLPQAAMVRVATVTSKILSVFFHLVFLFILINSESWLAGPRSKSPDFELRIQFAMTQG